MEQADVRFGMGLIKAPASCCCATVNDIATRLQRLEQAPALPGVQMVEPLQLVGRLRLCLRRIGCASEIRCIARCIGMSRGSKPHQTRLAQAASKAIG